MKAARFEWLRPFMLVLLTVLVPVFLYYFLYVGWQAANAKRRNFRSLSVIARAIQESSARRVEILAAAAWPKQASSVQDPGSKKPSQETKADEAKPNIAPLPQPPAGAQAEADKRKKLEADIQRGGLLQIEPLPGKVSERCAKRKADGGGTSVSLDIDHTPGQPNWKLELCLAGAGDKEAESIPALAPLRDLVPWTLAQQDFDAIIVRSRSRSDGNPDPAAQTGPGAALADNVGFPQELIHRVAPAGAQKEEGESGKAEGALSLPAFDFLGLSDLPVTTVAGTKYLTFSVEVLLYVPRAVLPSATPVEVDGTGIRLTLEGLVSQDRFQRQAVSLSPMVLTYVCGLVAVAFLVVPYLKIRFMARRERMRAIDMWMLAAAAFAGTALATLLILHFYGHTLLRRRLDDCMRGVARGIQEDVGREVGLIRAEIDRATPLLAAQEKCLPKNARSEGEGLILLSGRDLQYPDFEAFFCTDPEGVQLRKWMPRSSATQMVATGEYPYFQKALTLTGDTAASDGFVFDAIVAKTTGLPLAVFATPLDRAGNFGPQVPLAARTGVVVFSMGLRSLSDAALPFPYEYIVVDAQQQKMLFPSTELGRLRGEFFADVENDATLRQAIASAGHEGSAIDDWRYRGRMHRMQAFQIPALPGAALLVFYDKTIAETVSGEVMVNALFWAGLLMLAGLLGAVVARLLRADSLDWVWPTVNRWQLYVIGSFLMLAVALGVVAVSGRLAAWRRPYFLILFPAAMAVMLPLLASSGLGAALERRFDAKRLSQRVRRWMHPRAYLAFSLLLLLAQAAVPTALMFDDVVAAHHEAFESIAAARHRSAIEQRRRGDDARFFLVADDCVLDDQSTPGSQRNLETVAARCLHQTGGLAPVQSRIFIRSSDYARFTREIAPIGLHEDLLPAFAGPLRALDEMPRCSGFWSLGARGRRPHSYFSAWSSACVPAVTAWHAVLRDHVWAVDAAPGRAHRHLLTRSAFLPLVIPFALLALGIVAAVRSVAAHILGLNFEDDGVQDRSAEVLADGRDRWLLLRPTAAAFAQMRQQSWGLVLDLSDASLTIAQLKPDTPSASVLALNLECRLGSSEWREAMLSLVASPATRPLVLVSAIDPLHFLTERRDEVPPEQGAALAGEMDRWAHVLTTLQKARYALPAAGDGSASGPPPAADAELVRQLDDECRWSDTLRAIQRDLLRRPNFVDLDWNHIVEYVQDMAEPYYRMMWSLCSEEEKLTLVQLAQEGVVNPRAFDLLHRLRRRRLVRTDPRFRLINESFRRFVLAAEPPSTIKAWEASAAGQTWARLRVPLLVFLGVLTAILFCAQQPLFNQTLTIVAGVAGVVSAAGAVVARLQQAFSAKT